MSFSNDDTVLREFAKAWPIERLRTMSLTDYTSAGGKDSFVFWMESRLDQYGSMWGGSAFKFGIYSRSASSKDSVRPGLSYDESYGWYTKFGETAEQAFEGVRAAVADIAEAARDGRLKEIDEAPLGDTYKWKIAFHYQS